jgi:streptogramin lyase
MVHFLLQSGLRRGAALLTALILLPCAASTDGAQSARAATTISLGPTNSITRGPDGNMWATTGNAIARITPSGVITQFPLPDGYSGGSITAGSDGNLWFTEDSAIGRITPSGTITEFPYPRTGSNLTCIPSYDIWSSEDIAGAPSADVWFMTERA